MARTIPKSINDRLDFFRVRSQEWAANPGAVGLTAADAAALWAALAAADSAHAAAIQARQAAESATQGQSAAMDALVELGGALIAKIRAAAAADPGVYPAAGLAPPSGPTFTSVPPPAPPDFRCTPRYDGSVGLSWTSALARTSFYRVQRTVRAGGRVVTQFLAAVRDGSFIDNTLPVGFTSVEYVLTPVRQRRGGEPVTGPAVGASYTPGSVRTAPTRADARGAAAALAA